MLHILLWSSREISRKTSQSTVWWKWHSFKMSESGGSLFIRLGTPVQTWSLTRFHTILCQNQDTRRKFLINTSPLNSHKTMADNGDFLINWFITPFFGKGCNRFNSCLTTHHGKKRNSSALSSSSVILRRITVVHTLKTYCFHHVVTKNYLRRTYFPPLTAIEWMLKILSEHKQYLRLTWGQQGLNQGWTIHIQTEEQTC